MKMVAFMNAYTQGESGGDIWFIEVAKRMEGIDKTVVTSRLGKELCERNGLEARFLITTKEVRFKNVIFTYIRRIIKGLFIREGGDIFYATSDFLPDVLPCFFGKRRMHRSWWIQRVFHLITSSRPIPYFSQKLSFFFIKRWVDLVFVDNNLLREALVKKGFNPDRVVVSYPGVNIEYIQKIEPSEIGYDCVFLGRLKPSKGIFDLIEIWKLVCKERPDSRLAIIGYANTKIKRMMEEKIQDLGLDKNLFLLGYLSDEEAFGIIKASRVFVFPSHEEGFGIAIAEAMACGVPVVAYDLPVYREIFGEGIVIVPLGDIKRFSAEIVELLIDNNRYNKMVRDAVHISWNFSWDKTSQKEMDFYRR